MLWTLGKKRIPPSALCYIFLHLLQRRENNATSAQKMIAVSYDALYQFQMAAQLMQKEK